VLPDTCYFASFHGQVPAPDGSWYSTMERCKVELTKVVVISQDSLPVKDGHLSQK